MKAREKWGLVIVN
ncbi:unnamed protein product, partial [Rotaria sp. Silwood2]